MSITLLAPAGFCMGMMFPLRMSSSAKLRDLQPWFWSVNGATPVFGSVLGTIVSMEYGISCAFCSALHLCTVARQKISAPEPLNLGDADH
ncbi:MAG: hypothetical protein B7Z71_13135 [Acidocella sp. 21-58-7]|nr:MAG: hypothetical protein B7Z71_13135 [Acidocella sp. 21-58-7]